MTDSVLLSCLLHLRGKLERAKITGKVTVNAWELREVVRALESALAKESAS